MKTSKHTAFTLIELLVAITIIVILAGILVPVVRSTVAQSQKTRCVSNLKGMGQAALLYAADHDNNLVPWRMAGRSGEEAYGDPTGMWYDHLHEYYGRARGVAGRTRVDGVIVPDPGFVCPTVEKIYVINRICGWNGHGPTGDLPWYLKMGEGHSRGKVIELPGGLAKTAWFACPQEAGGQAFLPRYYKNNDGTFIGFPHSETSNVLFMSGRVENIPNPNFQENPDLLTEEKWIHFFGEKL